jgi:uncharacterized protein (TIGR03435 family)
MTRSILALSFVLFGALGQSGAAEFAAVSIRPIPAGTSIRAEALGIACRGADGIRQTAIASHAGTDPVMRAPRGRCIAEGVPLQPLIAFAYSIPPRNVLGGPDWVRQSGPLGFDPETFTFRLTDTFHVEGVADDPAIATTAQLKQMLQSMLSDRFALKFHREMRSVEGYALVVSKSGPRLKESPEGYESPRAMTDKDFRRVIKGVSGLNDLVDLLLPLDSVIDKTGLKGVYEYEFFAPLPPPPPPGTPPDPISGPNSALSTSLENQLGLRLQREKVFVDMVVIDRVERP